MFARVPWLEGASIAALLAALAAFAHAGTATLSGLVTALFAVGAPWIARIVARQGRVPDGVRGLPSLFIGAAAVAASSMVLGVFAPAGFCRVRALASGVAVGALFALQARAASHPGAWIAAVFTGLAAFAGALSPRGALAALPVGLAIAAFFVGLSRTLRAPSPDERVRRMYELSSLFVATALVAMSGSYAAHTFSSVLAAMAPIALGLGFAAGHSVVQPEEASRVARASAALVTGVLAAVATSAAGDLSLFSASVAAIVALVVDRTGLALTASLPSSRLALAARAAVESLAGQESVEDVARAALDPLRDPSDVRVTGELWLVDRAQRITLDVAGTVKFGELALDANSSTRALLSWLRSRPEEVAYADAMRDRIEERTDAPAVLSALHGRDAFCAVGGYAGGALACVLIVPRAGRVEPPAWDEREALRALGRRLAAALESSAALESARARAAEAERIAREAEASREDAVARCAIAEGRVARAPNIVRLSGTLETVWVGYSAPMRLLDQRLRAVAKQRDVTAIVCGAGGPREAVLWRLHGYAPWSGAPCAVLDAGRVHPRDALASLFGTTAAGVGDARVEAQSGVLELAGEGTLGLFDAQALGPDALAALAVALREGRARRVTADSDAPSDDKGDASHATFDVRARVVLFLRDAPMASGLPSELCDALGDDWITVPSLAARSEDLEARVLLAIDRSCRALGREPIGIGRDALEALRMWPFPGDDRELDEAIERAVAVASGRITVEDLPSPIGRPRSGTAPATAADADTFDALERRILEAALERSNGNKSEAARALGLARTTFLDKLRKYGLRE
ncbi:MAG: sigma 54-interacting transcriptional regulator [Myxococcales bacterium]|nr:sigma 54-interacting transcriptional regulator [Myxococcales bacterium]